MCRLARLWSPRQPPLRKGDKTEPLSEADELNLIFAKLPPDDRAVLLQLGRRLADTH